MRLLQYSLDGLLRGRYLRMVEPFQVIHVAPACLSLPDLPGASAAREPGLSPHRRPGILP